MTAAASLDRQIFSGDHPNHDNEEYLDWVHIQALHLNANTKPDRELVYRQYFRQGLRGRAKVWFDALRPDVRRNWPKLEDEFTKEFKLPEPAPEPEVDPQTTALLQHIHAPAVPPPQHPPAPSPTDPEAEGVHLEGHPLIGQRYPTLEAAEAGLRAAARADHYALSALSLHKQEATGDIRRRVWICNKGRKRLRKESARHPDESKRRKTETKRTGCPFRIAVKQRGYGYVVDRINSAHSLQHNHPKTSLSAHPGYRKEILDRLEESAIAKFRAGEKPSRILECLREECEDANIITISDLRNRFARYRATERQGSPA